MKENIVTSQISCAAARKRFNKVKGILCIFKSLFKLNGEEQIRENREVDLNFNNNQCVAKSKPLILHKKEDHLTKIVSP